PRLGGGLSRAFRVPFHVPFHVPRKGNRGEGSAAASAGPLAAAFRRRATRWGQRPARRSRAAALEAALACASRAACSALRRERPCPPSGNSRPSTRRPTAGSRELTALSLAVSCVGAVNATYQAVTA